MLTSLKLNPSPARFCNNCGKLVHQAVPGLEATIRWRLPTFLLSGQQLCNIGSFTAHCSLVIAPRSIAPILSADGFDGQTGMGQFGKISALKDLPPNPKLKSYFKLAAQHIKAPATAKRPAPTRKPTPPTPPELTAALKLKTNAAATKWKAFTPTKRRDCTEWITDAKRAETHARRLTTTLE